MIHVLVRLEVNGPGIEEKRLLYDRIRKTIRTHVYRPLVVLELGEKLQDFSCYPLPSNIQARIVTSLHFGSTRRASKNTISPSNNRTLTAIAVLP